MSLLKTILTRHLHSIFKPSNYLKGPPQNPNFLTSFIYSKSYEFSFPSSFSWKPFSLSAYFLENSKEKTQKCKKPLSVFFKKAVGTSENIEYSKIEGETDSSKLKKKQGKLAEEVKGLNKERHKKGKTLKPLTEKRDGIVQKGVKQSLYGLFSDKNMKKEVKLVEPIQFANEDSIVHNKLSSDMQMFAYHLYNEGYLKDASFMPKDKFDLTCFEASNARDFLKSAAVKFGRDHQKIAMWLSASDLKKVALFGCPSLVQRSVYAAKNLRRFFQIEEHQVCQLCTLKNSCKHANKMMKSKNRAIKLQFDDVTRVLVTYTMEVEPRQVEIPLEIKNCVSRLLKQVINLSQTVS